MRWWQCLGMLDREELPRRPRHAEDLGFDEMLRNMDACANRRLR